MAMFTVSYGGLDDKLSDRQMAKERSQMHFAASQGQLMVLHSLIKEGASVNKKTSMGYTPLHDACWTNHSYCASHLLKAGAEVDAMSSDGKTPLSLASSVGSKDCVKLLLDWKAKVNVEDESCPSPLHAAAVAGHHECVDLLIDEGGNVNGKNPYYGTPLHSACGKSSKECSSSLISSGANINALRKRDLQTPLHVAATVNCDQLVHLLVCNGADIHARDKQSKKPIDLVDKESSAHTLLQTFMTNPESLISLCRNQIRTSLGPSAPQNQVKDLDLPQPLKEYITYTEKPSSF
ncbi:ankyrin repeat and SOCS box protein 13-like [Lytechinus pictus]|uniref:ankyrin repeat and SOCS box protein 13-like n=1 Tax=Lytechinus pictus TaxID=7653 RepID=UPI00240DE987|nr:ankyrin repeat and SOCS box protein 13-like [Lytechinus pictus]